MANGKSPDGKGEPATGVSAPVAALIAKTVTVSSPLFGTRTNLLEGSTSTAHGPVPTANGEPATLVSAPVAASTENAVTLLVTKFAVYR